jgi:hypothetical protein
MVISFEKKKVYGSGQQQQGAENGRRKCYQDEYPHHA